MVERENATNMLGQQLRAKGQMNACFIDMILKRIL